jgi:phosphoribosylformimino-5-aminoimidazole carboxamide ribotide isomerase
MTFVAYPAIDVRDGRVVRLQQGDYDRETRYADDPFTVAMRYADAGARWLHLVDLDAARAGGYTLAPLLRKIADDGRLCVQTGGGVRDETAVATMLEQGASRVVIGSLAVREPTRVEAWL